MFQQADHRRTVERSMMQLEELRTSVSKTEPTCRARLEGFFATFIPSGKYNGPNNKLLVKLL